MSGDTSHYSLRSCDRQATGRGCSSSLTSVNRRGSPLLPRRAGHPWPEQMDRKMLRFVEKTGMVQKQVTPQGWLMSTPEGDAPDPTLTRGGSLAVASWTPSHPALVTHEDPRVEPCLIPCGPSWSRVGFRQGQCFDLPYWCDSKWRPFACMTPHEMLRFPAFLKISAGLILVASQSSATTCIHVSLDSRGQRSWT